MSSYRYPPANPEVQGAWSQAQYPQQQYTIPNEHYRAQPTIPPTSGAPLNLPPLRSIDPRQQQAYTPPVSTGPSYGGAQMVAGYPPMPGHMPAMPPQPQYYAGPMQHPAGHYDPAAYGQPMMRYPLPMGDPGRALQGGRHKKDVKRRTKTGCLTCRRRRIKCDEGHPSCRNCAKSKRECLGYDPIFKTQQSSPALPPPSSVSSQSSTATAGPSLSGPNYSAYSQGQSDVTRSPSSSFDCPKSESSIDYALPEDSVETESTTAQMPVTRVIPSRLENLFAINGYAPPPIPPLQTIDDRLRPNLLSAWDKTFSRALDSLLETTWFTSLQGTDLILGSHPDKDVGLEWEFASFLTTISGQSRYGDVTVPSQEARLVWKLAQTCHTAVVSDDLGQHSPKDDPNLASGRVQILKALLTGERLMSNPLWPSDVYGTPRLQQLPVEAQLQEYELEFWYSLGQFTTTFPVNNTTIGYDARLAEISLERMRNVLNAYENRDILYSIAMYRHIGEQYPGGNTSTEHERASYFVAKGFIEKESVYASTNVMQVICKMAARSWED